MNVHPDYIDMSGTGGKMTYPLAHYEGFLSWINDQYHGDVWQVLPRSISRFVHACQPLLPDSMVAPSLLASPPVRSL